MLSLVNVVVVVIKRDEYKIVFKYIGHLTKLFRSSCVFKILFNLINSSEQKNDIIFFSSKVIIFKNFSQ